MKRGETEKSTARPSASKRASSRAIATYMGKRDFTGLEKSPSQSGNAKALVGGYTYQAACDDVGTCCRKLSGIVSRYCPNFLPDTNTNHFSRRFLSNLSRASKACPLSWDISDDLTEFNRRRCTKYPSIPSYFPPGFWANVCGAQGYVICLGCISLG
jgi:hypothetical protein